MLEAAARVHSQHALAQLSSQAVASLLPRGRPVKNHSYLLQRD
jgi:hypothetical protein